MTHLLWFFAIVGYLGIGTVVAAVMRRDAIDGDPAPFIVLLWLPGMVLMGGAGALYIAGAFVSWPMRWLYCQIAHLPGPTLFGDDDDTPALRVSATVSTTSLATRADERHE